MEETATKLESIDSYHRMYGLPKSGHPLVSVLTLKKRPSLLSRFVLTMAYTPFFLKNSDYCTVKYGRKSYDYQAGIVTSFSPGQVVDIEMKESEYAPDIVGLIFHPDLMYGTPLADKIADFSFLDYSQTESLHLSKNERSKFLECLDKIKEEVEHPVDKHSAALVSVNIQVLLEYLHRFYDRQFITRHKINSEVIAKFERELKAYFSQPQTAIPNVAYFADKAHLTQGYFSDLIRKETGSFPKDLISIHIVSEAKKQLATTDLSVATIAQLHHVHCSEEFH